MLPVPTEVPPDGTVYQVAVPADGVALKVTVPEPQILPGVVLVILGEAFTVIGALVVPVHPDCVTVYVMTVFPAPATAGSNTPPVTPVPE